MSTVDKVVDVASTEQTSISMDAEEAISIEISNLPPFPARDWKTMNGQSSGGVFLVLFICAGIMCWTHFLTVSELDSFSDTMVQVRRFTLRLLAANKLLELILLDQHCSALGAHVRETDQRRIAGVPRV